MSPAVIGVVAVIALGTLMAGFILGRATAPDEEASGSESPASGSGSAEAPLVFPAGDVDRTGYWGLAGITPAVTDDFDRRDDPDSLGEADGGAWDSVAGGWAISGNRATLVTPAGSGAPSLAVVDGGGRDRLTEVTLSTVQPGAGLLFGFRGDQDFWALTADQAKTSWSITQVAEGTATPRGTINVPASNGTTVSVSQRGESLRFRVDGELVYQIDGAGIRRGMSGLVALEGIGAGAQWDRFFVGDLPPED